MAAANEGLASVRWDPRYTTSRSDLVRDFYGPALHRAHTYDRATGYFRSSFYSLTRTEVAAYALNGGKIRLICSPDLDVDDVEEIRRGRDATDAANAALKRELEKVLLHPHAASGADILAALLATDVLHIRLAIPAGHGIFHDKFGVFQDVAGNRLSFAGSINETWRAWHPLGNHESFEVFTSWSPDADRTDDHAALFEDLWESRNEKVAVATPSPETLEALRDRGGRDPLEVIKEAASFASMRREGNRRALFDHQRAALRAWRSRASRGILKHATGSGKTVTALSAIRDHLRAGGPALVIVPSTLLVSQWDDEARKELADIEPAVLLAGGGNSGWRPHLRAFTLPAGNPRLTISTIGTACRPDFLSRVVGGAHLLIVADEVHRMGALQAQHILTLEAGPRLGLSATPERAGDPEGTSRLFSYFGPVVPPEFSLADAIAAGRLCSYRYYVDTVSLTDEEQERWEELSAKIRQIAAMSKDTSDGTGGLSRLDPHLKRLLIRRARIAKGAEAKAPLVASIVAREYAEGEHWLVYCDDTKQLQRTRAELEALGVPSMEYRSGMVSDRQATLLRFERSGGVIVAIKCLDEGVDIPAISHAVIAASSRNPREFIQRRGRALRLHHDKETAVIRDIILQPPDPTGDDYKSLVVGEIARALEFSDNAVNESAGLGLRRLAIEWDLDADTMSAAGFEEEEEEEGGTPDA